MATLTAEPTQGRLRAVEATPKTAQTRNRHQSRAEANHNGNGRSGDDIAQRLSIIEEMMKTNGPTCGIDEMLRDMGRTGR